MVRCRTGMMPFPMNWWLKLVSGGVGVRCLPAFIQSYEGLLWRWLVKTEKDHEFVKLPLDNLSRSTVASEITARFVCEQTLNHPEP